MRTPALALFLVALAACRAAPVGPYTALGEGSRSTTEAEVLNRRGADLIQSDPAEAEALLRDALTKDLFFGPAHNNLGVVYLAQGRLYEAANEFEWARKLLPGNPDPRINLALCMERAGRPEDALRAYEAALEVEPESLPAMQGAAVLLVRTGRSDPRLPTWLASISSRSGADDWRHWAISTAHRRGDEALLQSP
jgi:tetratricopeptide (TPR) repeat protein